MKTIFITSFDGVETKNVLRSSIFSTILEDKNTRVVVFVKNEKRAQAHKAEFGDSDRIFYEVVGNISIAGLDRLFQWLKKAIQTGYRDIPDNFVKNPIAIPKFSFMSLCSFLILNKNNDSRIFIFQNRAENRRPQDVFGLDAIETGYEDCFHPQITFPPPYILPILSSLLRAPGQAIMANLPILSCRPADLYSAESRSKNRRDAFWPPFSQPSRFLQSDTSKGRLPEKHSRPIR